jgi:hypothetical protein
LGGQRESFLQAGEWRIGVAYRRLYADTWFVGSEANEAAAPFGQPLYLDINSFDFSVTYGVTDRLSLTLTLPFSYGTHSRFYADNQRHKVDAGGLGDLSLVGTAWLLQPTRHPTGNVALGLGVKTPTGNNEARNDFFNADGSVTQRVVDQSIQLGDGGFGIMLHTQAFQQVFPRAIAYVNGYYLLSLREKTDVPSPLPDVTLAVPDVYSARAGLAYALFPTAGVSVNLGGRIDGIPLRDIIGRGDDNFRRPGYTLYVDPGLAWRLGNAEVTVSLPLRVHQSFSQSLVDRRVNFPGGGDLANYLLFVGFTQRL